MYGTLAVFGADTREDHRANPWHPCRLSVVSFDYQIHGLFVVHPGK